MGCTCVWAGVTQRLVRAPGSSAVAHGSCARPRCIPLLPRDAGEPAGAAVPAAAAAAEGQGRCCNCAGRPPQQVGLWSHAWPAAAGYLHFTALHSMLDEVACIVMMHVAGWHMHTVALLACSAPHFSRSLEWLLFTALEANADGPAPAPANPSQPGTPAILCSPDYTTNVQATAAALFWESHVNWTRMCPAGRSQQGVAATAPSGQPLSAQPRTPSRSPGPQQLRSPPRPPADKGRAAAAAPGWLPAGGRCAAHQKLQPGKPCPPAPALTLLIPFTSSARRCMLGGLHGTQDGSPLHDMLRQASFCTEAPPKQRGGANFLRVSVTTLPAVRGCGGQRRTQDGRRAVARRCLTRWGRPTRWRRGCWRAGSPSPPPAASSSWTGCRARPRPRRSRYAISRCRHRPQPPQSHRKACHQWRWSERRRSAGGAAAVSVCCPWRTATWVPCCWRSSPTQVQSH